MKNIICFSFLVSLSLNCLAISTSDAVFSYTGSWKMVISDVASTCYTVNTVNDLDRVELNNQLFLSSSAQTLVYRLDFDGKKRNFIGEIVTKSNSLTDFEGTVLYEFKDGVLFTYQGVESDVDVTMQIQMTLDASTNSLNGAVYQYYKSANSKCETLSTVTLTKEQSIIYITATSDDGQAVNDIDITYTINIGSQSNDFTNKTGEIIAGEAWFPFLVESTVDVVLKRNGYLISPDQKQFDMKTNHVLEVKANIVETEQDARAIIIAGGGDFADALWPATNANANFAYRSLLFKGLEKSNIRYYNFDLSQDVDNDGSKNDIEGIPSTDNFKNSILDWAKNYVNDKKPLILYFLDHGLEDKFFITKPASGVSQIINSSTIDQWLDELQAAKNNKVILIYDACFSGSFMKNLAATGDQKRILIFSSDKDQLAYFGSRGDLSFSSFFWLHTIKGKSIRDSFLAARKAIMSATNNSQQAILDDNGDGQWDSHKDGGLSSLTYLGNPLVSAAALPVINKVSEDQVINTGSSVSFVAEVDIQADALKRVWAVQVPPDSADNGNLPVVDLKEYDLSYNSQNKSYQVNMGGFDKIGVYKVSFYAQSNDQSAFVSLPKTVKIASFDASDQIDDFFNRVENQYPNYFSPANQITAETSGYMYRYYAQKKTAIGVKDGRVYVLADALGGLKDVGSFAELDAAIK